MGGHSGKFRKVPWYFFVIPFVKEVGGWFFSEISKSQHMFHQKSTCTPPGVSIHNMQVVITSKVVRERVMTGVLNVVGNSYQYWSKCLMLLGVTRHHNLPSTSYIF